MVLCFGTFARTLKYCKPDVGAATDAEFVGTMTRTVDPSCGYINNSNAVSKLLSCTQGLSEGEARSGDDGELRTALSNVVEEAKKIDTTIGKERLIKNLKTVL